MSAYSIRRVTLHDAAIVARHRLCMFQDMGQAPDELADDLLQASRRALVPLLASGEYVGWFAVNDLAEVIAGAGAHIRAQLPRISLSGDSVADGPAPLVVNVYTDPGWRGRGIARALMRHLMDWTIEKGFERVVLHASDAGRPLYESLGFVATNEMRWSPGRGD